jgi:poly(beta-D-mannuronate) lyase
MYRCWLGISFIALSLSSAAAGVPQGLVLLDERRDLMAAGELPESRQSCLAVARDPEWINLAPVKALSETEGYGTDRSAEPFAWALMVLAGRSVGGDIDASTDLRTLLVTWAKSDAFSEVEQASDAHYALKRTLLPLIAAFSVERPNLGSQDQLLVSTWIGRLVQTVNHRFGTEVDYNNHRTLLDSVLASWGAVSNDEGIFEAGFADLKATLDSARDDGSLPLETQRGARSAWYMRQTISSMLVITEAALSRGIDVYSGESEIGKRLLRSTSYLANVINEPELSFAYSAVNYKPGSQYDFKQLDLGFVTERPTRRNYMAFLGILRERFGESVSYLRLAKAAHSSGGIEARIDEFVGGNAACFWGSR